MKKFEVNDVVGWYIDYTVKRTGELITQPFPDLPDIWLVRPYGSDELVLVNEDNLEHK